MRPIGLDSGPVKTSTRGFHGAGSFAAITVAGAIAVATLATVNPEEPGHYPTCPSLTLTGFFCPGCGSLRAVHALTQGDVGTALERNPLAVVAAPFLIAAWLLWAWRLFVRPDMARPMIPARWIWALLALIVVYTVARNIPGWTLLSPV